MKKNSKKNVTKQTTNAIYNLTIGKAINATVYKVKLAFSEIVLLRSR